MAAAARRISFFSVYCTLSFNFLSPPKSEEINNTNQEEDIFPSFFVFHDALDNVLLNESTRAISFKQSGDILRTSLKVRIL